MMSVIHDLAADLAKMKVGTYDVEVTRKGQNFYLLENKELVIETKYCSFVTWFWQAFHWGIAANWKSASTKNAIPPAALKQKSSSTDNLVHHSDRGVQYCSQDYVKVLKKGRNANQYD